MLKSRKVMLEEESLVICLNASSKTVGYKLSCFSISTTLIASISLVLALFYVGNDLSVGFLSLVLSSSSKTLVNIVEFFYA